VVEFVPKLSPNVISAPFGHEFHQERTRVE